MTMYFLNDVIYGVELTQKIDKYVIIATLKSGPMVTLINRIPGICLLISSLPGKALKTLAGSGKSGDSTIVLKALPDKLYSPSNLYNL